MDSNNIEKSPEKLNGPIEKVERSFDISSFSKFSKNVIAVNDKAYEWSFNSFRLRHKKRTLEDIEGILSRGDVAQERALSEEFFDKGGFYKRIIAYYASLLKYIGVLVPSPGYGKSLSTTYIKKRYVNAVDYLSEMNLPVFLADCAQKVLRRGVYYGLILNKGKDKFSVLDLPYEYCRTTLKTFEGVNVIELDLSYFDRLIGKRKKETLNSYPKYVIDEYNRYQKNAGANSWVKIPPEDGVYFNFWGDRPFFLTTIPASLQYDEAVETEMERDKEEIRKIIVQKIPHLSDGSLLFEPEEAEYIHKGTVGMLKGNKNVSVLTTYADVDSVTSRSTSDLQNNALDKMGQNIYNSTGTSSQIFASTGSTTLGVSLDNDLALMMHLADKFSVFITRVINNLFANTNISFAYKILPISYYNSDEYVDRTLKMANNGYSFLLPALALGMSQKDLGNLKELENDVLNLEELLIPLASSHTQSSSTDGPGAPTKKQEDKNPKTIENEESADKQAQGGL